MSSSNPHLWRGCQADDLLALHCASDPGARYSPFRSTEPAGLHVSMRDRELVGGQGGERVKIPMPACDWSLTTCVPHPRACAGIKVLHHVKPQTRSLDLSHNHLLGADGLRTILGEICREGAEDEVELERLLLVDCGLGGPGARVIRPLPFTEGLRAHSLESPARPSLQVPSGRRPRSSSSHSISLGCPTFPSSFSPTTT
jgi:hypothetical protein